MNALNPYLNFPGTTEEAFELYRSVFGGEFIDLMRFKDMPMEGNDKLSEAELKKIMHMALPLPNGNMLMATDVVGERANDFKQGNNISIAINTDSKEETNRMFKGLSVGGFVEIEPQEVSWSPYFAMFRDRFGIQWMLNYDVPLNND